MAVHVVNAYGAVRIEGVAEATVRNRHGEVFVTDVSGACVLETSYEDVEVTRVAGECRVVNSNAEVRAGSELPSHSRTPLAPPGSSHGCPTASA